MMETKENQETQAQNPDCAAFKAWSSDYIHYRIWNSIIFFITDDSKADHDFEHIKTMGRCLNQYKCRKCKQFLIVDSGD